MVLVLTPLLGLKVSSWQDVQAAVARGDVDSVRVVGELRHGESGYGVVQVRWRHGLLAHQAEVVQMRGHGVNEYSARSAGDGDVDTLLHSPPSSRLLALQPGLDVQRESRSGGARLVGFEIPRTLGLAALGLFGVGFMILLIGPQPWRATRWAWFWLLVPPLGGFAFLVLSGRTPFVRDARPGHRRLTGGWAFVIGLVVSSALGPWRW